jgi:glycosyltransferase involved in cell wall biosynthesis
VAARPELVALLPVRNAERWLSEWLAAASEWADGVIALDDGSTDASRVILQNHPLVRRVLRNPVRPTFEGWDDRANRQRLLDAAEEFSPRWVMFLDADERVAPTDVEVLGRIIRDEDPSFAYGLRIHAATDDLQSVESQGRWVYRLFGWEPGLELPDKKLHLVPTPISIPRRRWLRTTVRLLHMGTTDESDRAARFEKYREADPDRRWQSSYGHLLDHPVGMTPLLPVHVGSNSNPTLTAVVISRGDEPGLVDSVASVVNQVVPGDHEVIVVISDGGSAGARIRDRFPDVQLVELPDPALPGTARNAGLALARGDFVAFPSSHIVLPVGSLAARVRSHSEGWAMVTGSVMNGNATRAGWASYFLDHSTLLPDRPSGELTHPPTRCSYVRFLLDEVGGFPEDRRAGEDTVVNTELWRRDFSAYRNQDAAAIHLSPCSTARRLVSHHYARGMAWAQILRERHGSRRRVLLRRGWLLAFYVPRRLMNLGRNVRSNGRGFIRPYRMSYPWIVLGALSAFWGIIVGLVSGEKGRPESA